MLYNYKYQRSGSLIENRYKSEPIEDERYFLAVARYIHQNPLKAKMVEKISEYKWSSYNEYLGKTEIIDRKFLLNMLANKKSEAKKLFIKLHEEFETENFHISDRKKLTDDQVKRKIVKVIKNENVKIIGNMPKEKRNEILRKLRFEEGLTIGQLERLTGISRGIITRSV